MYGFTKKGSARLSPSGTSIIGALVEALGQYKILEKIGAGGVGDLYRARDTRTGRTVSLDIVPPAVIADRERRARFLKHAQAAARLSHPNIAALYEAGEDKGEVFL